METYVINLKKRPDRLKDFISRYKNGHVNVFFGFDGLENYENLNSFQKKLLKSIKKVSYYPEENYPGVLGCWVSHYTIWSYLITSNHEYFTIFEDDAFFTEDFENKFNFIKENLPKNVDLLYLGGNYSPILEVPTGRAWRELVLSEELKLYTTSEYTNPISDTERNFTRTAHAYVIREDFAKKCLEKMNEIIEKEEPLLPVDEFLNDLKFSINYYDLFPQITYSPFKYQSDIWKD